MTTPMHISRLALVPAVPAQAPGATVVRRYRLARLDVNGRPAARGRHEHLKPVHN